MEKQEGKLSCKGFYPGNPDPVQTEKRINSYTITTKEHVDYKCASFFAGVGGIDIGFEQAGFKTLYANEVDPYPVKTFEANFDLKVDLRSITDVKPEDIPSNCNIYLAGFPCTDISIAGYRQGLFNEDGSLTRSGLYYELLRLIKKNKPHLLNYAYFLSCRTRRNFIITLIHTRERNQELIKKEINITRKSYHECKHLFSLIEKISFRILFSLPTFLPHFMLIIQKLRLNH